MPGELDEVLEAFEALVRDHEVEVDAGEDEETNFRCVDCVGCSSCRFCTSCERCVDCTYCDACNDCEGCTQCRECLACATCSHSTHSAYCEKSSYLTLCLDCDGCVQCFACVGLSGEEFCVLNQRYTRRAYFKKVSELRAALDARTLEGWFPPWLREDDGPAAGVRQPEPPAPREPDPPPRARAADPAPMQSREPPRDPDPHRSRILPPRIETAEPRREADPLRRSAPPSEPERPSPFDAPTVHPEPLTEIAAAERTGSWPPIDHESARALDRSGSSPWDDLDADADVDVEVSESEGAPELDTVKRPLPAPSRFGKDAGAGGRFGGPPKERPTSLLDDDVPEPPVDKRALLDGLPVAGRRPEQRPAEPKPVEETGGGGRLTRAQRPARDGDQPAPAETSAPGSLRAARRPRRPGR